MLEQKKQAEAYGLGIVTRSSSDWIQTRVPQTRGLSREHNRFLKHIFKGAATTVITQRHKDPIHARYQQLLDGGTKPTLAKLSLARTISATVLRIAASAANGEVRLALRPYGRKFRLRSGSTSG